MRRIEILLAGTLLLAATSADAKRAAPAKVDPVVHAGIRYEAPNKNPRAAMVEAWEVASGKKLWERVVYEAKINPAVEEDVQWDFITGLEIEGEHLLVKTESGKQYRIHLKTRKVERVDKSSGSE